MPVKKPRKATSRTASDKQRSRDAAARALARIDPAFRRLMRAVGPFAPEVHRDAFVTLLGSIVHQQISMSAAASIQARLIAMCEETGLTPAAVYALSTARLRKTGLSRQKTEYVRGLAKAFLPGGLTTRRLRAMDDDEVIRHLTELHGIGVWTVQMLLIFCLERLDVWPADDFGLRSAVQRWLGLAELPKRREMNEIGERWRPQRTCATWYLWRSLENPIQPGVVEGLSARNGKAAGSATR